MEFKLFLALSSTICCVFVLPACAQNFPEILTPYRTGVENFNVTLEHLIDYDENDANLGQFVTELFNSVKNSHKGFSASEQAATTKHSQLSTQQAQLQANIDQQRESLRVKVAAKQVKQTELQGKQNTLAQAETHLANTQRTLAGLEAAVRRAEEKVDEARHCLHKRRKRGWGSWNPIKRVKKVLKKVEKHVIRPVVKPIVKPIERGICAVYNKITGELRDKKRLRDQTKRDAANQRNSVAAARQAVQATNNEIAGLNQAIASLTSTISSLNQQISQLNSQQVKVISLKEKLSQVDQFLSALSNRMGTSVDAIKTSQAALVIQNLEEVVDFVNIINPILETGAVLQGDTGTVVPALMRPSDADMGMISENLQALKEKLEELKEQYGDDAELFEAIQLNSQ